MLGNKDYIGLTIQDDFIRMARVRVSGNDIKLIKLDQYSLVEKLKKQSKSTQLETEGASVFDDFEENDQEADSIFGLEEKSQEDELDELDFDALEDEMEVEDDDFATDMVEESETPQSNELLLYNLLSSIEDKKLRLGLNIPAGNTIFQVIRDTDFNEVKRKDLVEDLEDKLHSIYGVAPSPDNYSYEIRENGSLLLGSVDDESITLQLLNDTLELYSGKVIVEDITPDEIALVGLVRANYELEADEITGIIQLGKQSCRVVFMKGEEVWLVSPIINEGTEEKSFLNTVFSKILFQLDTGEVPNLDRILLANNTIGDSAVDFFEENFPDIEVQNLTLKEELFDTENIDPSSVPGFTTAIGSALAASGGLTEEFPKLSFVPTYVEDRQKIFKLQWHGVVILVLIFLTPIGFNHFYQQNAQEIDSLSSELEQINSDIRQLDPIVQNTRELESKIEGLKNKLVLLDDLSENSREWSTKMDILNEGIDGVNNSWITSMGASKDGVNLQGYTLYRTRIPEIVNIFEEATLLGVSNEEMREQRVYNFKISVDKFAESNDVYSPPKPEEVENLLSGK